MYTGGGGGGNDPKTCMSVHLHIGQRMLKLNICEPVLVGYMYKI